MRLSSTRRNKVLRGALSAGIAMLCLGLHGCFTGVESTPRIEAPKDAGKTDAAHPEATLLSDVTREATSAWKPGKAFIVTDRRFSRLITSPRAPQVSEGDTVRFVRFQPALSVVGDSVTDAVFALPSGDVFPYRIDRPLSQLLGASSYTLTLPFTIDASMVDKARQRLVGNTYYPTTRLWRDDADNIIGGKAFVPVTVIAVEPGDESLPLKIRFREVVSSGQGMEGILLVNPEPNAKTPRTFAKQFVVNNPRKQHSAISDKNWKLITEGNVALGMTTEECLLALGSPKDIQRFNTSSIIRQQWVYDNGQLLVFEDGLLVSKR